jgi:hypothetical protein
LQILEDTGKILVLPVLCTSIVVPVSRPAASYYPKSLFHLPQDALFGIVYVPPENSKYCIGDPFNEIENELLDFSTNFENVCII